MPKPFFNNHKKPDGIPILIPSTGRALGQTVNSRFLRALFEPFCVGVLFFVVVVQSIVVSRTEPQLVLLGIASIALWMITGRVFMLFVGAWLSHGYLLYFMGLHPLFSAMFLAQSLIHFDTSRNPFDRFMWTRASGKELLTQFIQGDILIVLCLGADFVLHRLLAK